jgi:hypothetical protein
MFIGTRQRKNFRKETKYLRPPSAYQNGPRVRHPSPCTGTNRGHGPLLQRGKRLSAWERLVAAMPGFVRPHSRHSALDRSLPRSAVRPHSVIPDLIRNPCSSERDSGKISGRRRNISGHLRLIKMDPRSVIPDLIRDRGDARSSATPRMDLLRSRLR